MTHPNPAPSCTHERGCITCFDEGLLMRVAAVSGEDGFAGCVDPEGALAEVQVDLVGPVTVGDALLVHAGVALVHLGRFEGGQ